MPRGRRLSGGSALHRRHFISLVLAALSALAPNLLWSAEDTGSVVTSALEEIIVTARRRDETLMDVPMSMTRLDGATLDILGYRNIDEFLSLSPGVLVYTGGDGVSPQITIRGVVTPGDFVEPGNSVYVDEVYASGMRTVLPGFYDIEVVQVLKGPQAGLYGRNTTGGAVLITTGQPTEELSARIDASRAQYDAREVDGTVNVPLSDALRLRATGWYSKEDGGYYEDTIVGENLDAFQEQGGRITFAALANERTTFTLTGEYTEIKGSDFDGIVAGALLGPAPLAPESRPNVLRDDVGGLKQDAARINGKLDVDLNTGSVIAVAGWRKVRARTPGSDFDGTAYAASYTDFLANPSNPYAIKAPQIIASDDRDNSHAAELRYLTPDDGGPLRAQLGVSYFGEDTRLFGQVFPVRDFARILAAIDQNGNITRSAGQDSTSWAGFTELIWTPMPTVEVTTDLRYTRDHKSIDSLLSATGYYSQFGLSNVALDTSDTFENWSPGITLAYQPDDTLTLFGKYVRGFRAGGYNTLVNNPALQTYDSEEAESYELGLKSLLFDRRLEVGASVFYLHIDNALVPQVDPGELQTFFPLQNPGTVETTGLEVDLTAQVTDGLSLTASGGAYNNSISNGGVVGGDKRPYAPDYTAGLVANFEHSLTPAITGLATLGYRHRSGGRVPSLSEISMDSYNLVDAQLGIRFNNMQVSGFVQNALDDRYVIGNHGLSSGQAPYVAASGLNSFTTRSLVRDPGAVFGVRLTVTL